MRCGRIPSPNPNFNLNLNLSLNRDLYLSPKLTLNLGPYLNLNHNLNLDLYLNPNCPTLGTVIPPEGLHRGRSPSSSPTTTASRQHPKSGVPAPGSTPRPTPRS